MRYVSAWRIIAANSKRHTLYENDGDAKNKEKFKFNELMVIRAKSRTMQHIYRNINVVSECSK